MLVGAEKVTNICKPSELNMADKMESREENAEGRSLSWTTGLTLGHEVLGTKLGEENEIGSLGCGELVGVIEFNEGDWVGDVGCIVMHLEGPRVGEQTLLDGCDESSVVG
eukprot:scaffold3779_cov254-Ochromonas_danica.AAC.1